MTNNHRWSDDKSQYCLKTAWLRCASIWNNINLGCKKCQYSSIAKNYYWTAGEYPSPMGIYSIIFWSLASNIAVRNYNTAHIKLLTFWLNTYLYSLYFIFVVLDTNNHFRADRKICQGSVKLAPGYLNLNLLLNEILENSENDLA